MLWSGTSPKAAARLLVGCLLLLGTVGGLAPTAGATALAVGYKDHTYASSVSAPTAEKPQSKLWYTDGTWWGVLWDQAAGGYAIHRFNLATQATQAWTSTGVQVDARPKSQADVLWDEATQKLYVVTHLTTSDSGTTDRGLRFRRFGYDGTRYTSEVTHTIVNAKTEAAVMDRDGTGRLWVTWTAYSKDVGGRLVKVAHSTSSDTSWTAPYTLPVSSTAVATKNDDISALVSYRDSGGGKIGVLWSNQRTSALYFATHADGAPDTAWSLTALCAKTYCPDDHLNIKSLGADPSGQLFAVVKTSNNDKSPDVPDDPLIQLYRLNPAGSWSSSTVWTVGEGNMTRPIVMLDTTNRLVHAFASGPCCNGGSIFTKTASFDDLAFPRGNGTVFMRSAVSGEGINNPTSSKQTVNSRSGLLVLASIDSTRSYAHNYLPLGGTTEPTDPTDTDPPTVTSVTPADGAQGVPVSATVSASFSEPLDPATVNGSTFVLRGPDGSTVPATVAYTAGALTARLTPSAPLPADSVYTARLVGGTAGIADTAGNALASDRTWQFRTEVAGSGGAQSVSVKVSEDSWVHGGLVNRNYGTSTMLNVDASPVAVTYLKFDLSGLAGRTVTGAALRVRVTSSGSKGTQAVRTVADSSWSESTLTYANRPALGTAVLGRLGPTAKSTTYTVPLDATALTRGLGGLFTLGLDTTSTDGVDLGSREAGLAATLELDVE